MLHPAIVVKSSDIQGKGLFATRDIRAGEVTWRADPGQRRFHVDVIRSWPKEKQEEFYLHAWQVGEGWYEGPEDGTVTDPADYMNHSCDPNTWFVDDSTMVARRDIKKGEEITYDYATSETAEDVVVPSCNCGSAICRKIVKGADYCLNPTLRQRYGKHVMSHVLEQVTENLRMTSFSL